MALTKIDDRGLKTPIELLNDEELTLGNAGSKLKLYHDGNNQHSFIEQVSSVNALFIEANHPRFRSRIGHEMLISANLNGAVELYYDNSKKLETHTNGVNIHGRLLLADSSGVNDNRVRLGNNGDLSIYHDGTHSYLHNLTGELKNIAATWKVVNAANSEKQIVATQNDSVELYYDNSKKLETTSTGVTVTGSLYSTGSIDVQDNGALLCGTGDDLQIFHNGSGSFIDAYTTDLEIRNHGTELMAEFRLNNAVDLYHDGTKRLSTHAQGAIVNGHTLYIKGASGEDARLFFIANNSASYNDHYSINVAATGAFAIQTEVNANTFENLITATQHGNVELYHDNVKKLETISTGLNVTGGIRIGGNNSANELDDYEEGTWTPDLQFGGSNTGITYASRYGHYTKIGRQVTVIARINLSSKGSASGSAKFEGLPFATKSITGTQMSIGSIWFSSGGMSIQGNKSDLYYMVARTDGNATTFVEPKNVGYTSEDTVGDSDFGNQGDMTFTITYLTS